MASVKERFAEIREHRPLLDHALRMQEHYGEVKASQQAGAVTYFGFLSFFPIMALAFFAVGWVAKVFPEAQDALLEAIEDVLPGIVGGGENEISLADIQDSASTVRCDRSARCPLRRAGLVVGDARRVVRRVREARLRAAELRDRQAARPAHAGRGRGGAAGQRRHLRRCDPLLGGGARRGRARRRAGLAGVAARDRGRARRQHGALLRDVPAAGRPRRAQPVPVVRCALRRHRLRAAQAALQPAAVHDRGPAGLPGVRDRADPAGLDQLLLPRRHVRRLLGLHDRARPARCARGRAGPGAGAEGALPRAARGRRTHRRRSGSPPPPAAPRPCSPWSRW